MCGLGDCGLGLQDAMTIFEISQPLGVGPVFQYTEKKRERELDIVSRNRETTV
jgi:hypothetical protein